MIKKKTMNFDSQASRQFPSSASKLKENRSFDEKMDLAKIMKQAAASNENKFDFHRDFKMKEESRTVELPQSTKSQK